MAVNYDVVVVGAGFSGLYAMHKFRDQMGLKVKGFEAAGGPGGTWWWNRYPGARCDIESLHYSYSFSEEIQKRWQWSERFAAQPEILSYLEFVADTLDLRKDFTFDIRVTSAVWDDEAHRWTITTNDGAACTTRFLIAASGNLSIPKPPDFEGIEDFAGEVYTTSQWPHHEVDLKGKRVAVIGTGSTGIQVIQEVAKQAAHMTVFQRTANFALPLGNEEIEPERRAWISENHAQLRAGCRESFMGIPFEPPEVSGAMVPAEQRHAKYEKLWSGGGWPLLVCSYADVLSDQAINDDLADFVRGKIRDRVKDPKVADLLCPKDHPIATKRLAFESDYFDVFNQDNVDLVDLRSTPIVRLSRTGIVTTEKEYPIDVLIVAIGFDAATGPLVHMGLTGRGGVTLAERWKDGPRNYLGIAMHDFPNLFTITGPTSAVALYNNPLAIEDHVDLAADAVRYTLANDAETIEATAEAEDRWATIVHGLLHMTLFPKANSWYMGANVEGKRVATYIFIGSAQLYRTMTGEVQSTGYGGFAVGKARNGLPPMMKLDPAVTALLGVLMGQGAKPLHDCTVEETRAVVDSFSMLQGAARDVDVVETTYPSAGADRAVRIYRPDRPGPLPVVVFYHGGGFIAGSLDMADKPCRALAEDLGAIVVAPSYRLAPENPFPAATDDTFAALCWTAAHIATYGGDPSRIAVSGESAGGLLAAVAALRARDEGGPRLTAQVLITPAIDGQSKTASKVEFSEGPILSARAAEGMFAAYMGEGGDFSSPLASPVNAKSLAGLPPALVLSAECDPLRDEGEIYARQLAAAGIEVKAIRLDGLVHATLSMAGVIPRAREITEHMQAFLDAAFLQARVKATPQATVAAQ
ncbi:flavin-containing monooxygenase [Zavarzinia marina]|uniref:flavin-containing monooxygenase n=1 Tax=Zavarzinia marina TaxID=2911065 RepID=UPI0022A83C1C|nr:alpha/beta hydrolase fold domain-containing protein [Zavarzinia marina]